MFLIHFMFLHLSFVLGAKPCCAVLKPEENLFITTESDGSGEEIPIHCVETIVVNSKRIGHENGIMIAYKKNNDPNAIEMTYLQNEKVNVVMEWTNLILYVRSCVFKKKYPHLTNLQIASFLNFLVVKESYVPFASKGLIYISLTEARLCCFKHHLDKKPLFQIAISASMNLKASEYMGLLVSSIDVEPAKIPSYTEWVAAVEKVLKKDKISNLPGMNFNDFKLFTVCIFVQNQQLKLLIVL